MPGGSTKKMCPFCLGILFCAQKICSHCKKEQPLKKRLQTKLQKFDQKRDQWVAIRKKNHNNASIKDEATVLLEKLQAIGYKPVLLLGKATPKGEKCEVIMPRCILTPNAEEFLKKISSLYVNIFQGWSQDSPGLELATTEVVQEATREVSLVMTSDSGHCIPSPEVTPFHSTAIPSLSSHVTSTHSSAWTLATSSSLTMSGEESVSGNLHAYSSSSSQAIIPIPSVPMVVSSPTTNGMHLSRAPGLTSNGSNTMMGDGDHTAPLLTATSGEATKCDRKDCSSPAPPMSLSTARVQSQPQQTQQAVTQGRGQEQSQAVTTGSATGKFRNRGKKRSSDCSYHTSMQTFPIKRVIKERVRKGKAEILIHWEPCPECGHEWAHSWQPKDLVE